MAVGGLGQIHAIFSVLDILEANGVTAGGEAPHVKRRGGGRSRLHGQGQRVVPDHEDQPSGRLEARLGYPATAAAADANAEAFPARRESKAEVGGRDAFPKPSSHTLSGRRP